MAHRRGPGKESLLYSQVLETESPHATRGCRGRIPASRLNQAGGELREHEDLQAGAFTGGHSGVHEQKA